jgi:hypothetical protein
MQLKAKVVSKQAKKIADMRSLVSGDNAIFQSLKAAPASKAIKENRIMVPISFSILKLRPLCVTEPKTEIR